MPLLVLGGDQVYPVATQDGYKRRFVQPFTDASATAVGEEKRAHMVALPGNHDWYDYGLKSFLTTFANNDSSDGASARELEICALDRDSEHRGPSRPAEIGCWDTFQTRSYFAVQLTASWWLWGVDSQLDKDIDEVQRDYFKAVRDKMRAPVDERTGSACSPNIIMCTARPSWTDESRFDTGNKGNSARQILVSFLADIFPKHDDRSQVRLLITGDKHHYVHYCVDLARQKQPVPGPLHMITCGGGGAFMSGTLTEPETLQIPWDNEHWGTRDKPAGVRYRMAQRDPSCLSSVANSQAVRACLPSRAESRRLALRGVFLTPLRNGPSLWLLVGLVYLLLALAFGRVDLANEWPFLLSDAGIDPSPLQLTGGMLLALVGTLVLWASLLVYSIFEKKPTKPSLGDNWRLLSLAVVLSAAHTAAHLATMWFLVSGLERWWRTWEGTAETEATAALGILAAWCFAGMLVFSSYLALTCALCGLHQLDGFSALRLARHKYHLRVHVTPGALHVHVVRVRKRSRRDESGSGPFVAELVDVIEVPATGLSSG